MRFAPHSLLLLGLLACGGDEPAGGSGSTSRGSSGPVPPIANEAPPADRAAWGSIEGVVLFEGEPPSQRELSGPLRQPGCGEHEHPPTREEVTVQDGKLRDVLVRLRTQDLHADALGEVPSEPAQLRQSGCIYRPHVVGLMAGQELVVSNEDQTEHNVHAKPQRAEESNGARLNRGQQAGGAPLSYTFSLANQFEAVPFQCDLHPWMKAWVGVVEHRYFAVSDADGRFVLPEVPPGDYWLEAWHETLGNQRVRVSVPSGGAGSAEFVYRP